MFVRISSIEPTTIDTKMIRYWKDYPNLCKYLHLPIQSATDDILKLMRRKYKLDEFSSYIKSIKEIPEICLGTDIIVGFPGETDDLFTETKNYLQKYSN